MSVSNKEAEGAKFLRTTITLAVVFGLALFTGAFFLLQDAAEQQAQPQQVHQTPVDNIQFSKRIDGYRHIYIDDQLGIVCIHATYRLACVPQQDIKPEGMAELRAQAKSQAAARKAAAEKAAAEKANTSH